MMLLAINETNKQTNLPQTIGYILSDTIKGTMQGALGLNNSMAQKVLTTFSGWWQDGYSGSKHYIETQK